MADNSDLHSIQQPAPFAKTGFWPWLKHVGLLTWKLFSETEAEQRAAAFAYYAFFSLIPLLTLIISVGSHYLNAKSINELIDHLIPLESVDSQHLWKFVHKLEEARGGISIISVIILGWASFRFFQALVRAVNRVWHTKELPWWQMPLKNLLMIGIMTSAIIFGILAPAIIQSVKNFALIHFPAFALTPLFRGLDIARYGVGTVVLFYSFALLYMTAPRHRIKFVQVWPEALLITVLLQITQIVFINYVTKILKYNALYGTVGAFMFLLMWIYVSGLIIIAGACISAARERIKNPETKPLA